MSRVLRPLKRLLRRLLPPPALELLRRAAGTLRSADPRRLARRRAFRAGNRGADGEEIALRPWLRLAIDPRSREAFEWYAFGNLEAAQELDAFAREAAGRHALLDVGASHGLFSLAFTAGRPESAALAVEPSPVAWEILEENLARNRRDNVAPVRLAAGSAEGRLAMRQVWHHLEALPAGADPPGSLSIPVRRLDVLCAERRFEPDLLKVDVEGYELEALAGARGLLAERRPPIFLEVHPRHLAGLGQRVGELLDLLAGFGYAFRSLRGRPLAPSRLCAEDSVFHVVCVAPGAGATAP